MYLSTSRTSLCRQRAVVPAAVTPANLTSLFRILVCTRTRATNRKNARPIEIGSKRPEAIRETIARCALSSAESSIALQIHARNRIAARTAACFPSELAVRRHGRTTKIRRARFSPSPSPSSRSNSESVSESVSAVKRRERRADPRESVLFRGSHFADHARGKFETKPKRKPERRKLPLSLSPYFAGNVISAATASKPPLLRALLRDSSTR